MGENVEAISDFLQLQYVLGAVFEGGGVQGDLVSRSGSVVTEESTGGKVAGEVVPGVVFLQIDEVIVLHVGQVPGGDARVLLQNLVYGLPGVAVDGLGDEGCRSKGPQGVCLQGLEFGVVFLLGDVALSYNTIIREIRKKRAQVVVGSLAPWCCVRGSAQSCGL